ncbi:chemotaxis protein CheW, partial [Insolitispirillum peregrinum]
ADRVFEVTALDQTNVEPPPDIGMAWQSQAVIGLGRRNGALVIVLDVNSLFDADDLPAALLQRGEH